MARLNPAALLALVLLAAAAGPALANRFLLQGGDATCVKCDSCTTCKSISINSDGSKNIVLDVT